MHGLCSAEDVAARKKVLVVEDNSDLRRLYAIGLNQHHYAVKLASNGAEAVERFTAEKPHIILLDIMMPVMDGWEVIEKVNPPERTHTVPVLVISGHAPPEDRVVPPCVVAWLPKPFTISELVVRIEEVFNRPRRRRSPSAGSQGENPQMHSAS